MLPVEMQIWCTHMHTYVHTLDCTPCMYILILLLMGWASNRWLGKFLPLSYIPSSSFWGRASLYSLDRPQTPHFSFNLPSAGNTLPVTTTDWYIHFANQISTIYYEPRFALRDYLKNTILNTHPNFIHKLFVISLLTIQTLVIIFAWFRVKLE